MTTGTVTLHRVLPAPPERVYRAFLDPDAMAKSITPSPSKSPKEATDLPRLSSLSSELAAKPFSPSLIFTRVLTVPSAFINNT